MGDEQEVLSSEACPSCGCVPGEGVTLTCEDPNGCGAWIEIYRGLVVDKELTDLAEELKQFFA
jgi:hypothetical protein